MDTLKTNIRLLMAIRDVNQTKLAALADMSLTNVNHIVSGKTKFPQWRSVCKLATALDCSPELLFSTELKNRIYQVI